MTDDAWTIYVNGRDLARFYSKAAEMQIDRLQDDVGLIQQDPPSTDEYFAVRAYADFYFLLVSLSRLRRAAMFSAEVPSLKDDVSAAVEIFDAALPELTSLRNVSEHFDEYLLGDGRNKAISVDQVAAGLRIFMHSSAHATWLDHTILYKDCIAAANELLVAIENLKEKFRAN